jgi:hypothetical protein
MNSMASVSGSRRIVLLVAVLMLPTLLLASQRWERRGRKYKPPPPVSKITVLVKSERYDKPIEDAAVVFHSVAGDKDKGYMELKTDSNGKAVIDVIPIGDTFQLQVLKNGYDTFGQNYVVKGPTKSITVRLLPPQPQYSVYKKHPDKPVGIGGAGTTQPKSNTASSANKN